MSYGRFEPMGGWGYAGSSRRPSTAQRAVDVIRAREEVSNVTSPVLGEEVEVVPTEVSRPEMRDVVLRPETHNDVMQGPQFEFPTAEF